MPITIKQGLMKYKNGQNEYIGINTVGETSSAQQISNINQAGATQVAAVNTAGSTQVSAVNTKGQEVLASIPSDYTALSDEVGELKDALTLTQFSVAIPYLEVGYIDSNHEYSSSVKYRMATSQILQFDKKVLLQIPVSETSYNAYVYFYDQNGDYISNSSVLTYGAVDSNTYSMSINANQKFMIEIRRASETQAQASYAEFTQFVKLYVTDETKFAFPFSTTANKYYASSDTAYNASANSYNLYNIIEPTPLVKDRIRYDVEITTQVNNGILAIAIYNKDKILLHSVSGTGAYQKKVVKTSDYPGAYYFKASCLNAIQNIGSLSVVVEKMTTISAEVSDIEQTANDNKSKINEMVLFYDNIFNKDATKETGYLTNGVVGGSSGTTYDYTPVTKKGTYIANMVAKTFYGGNYNNCIAFYDSSKSFLRNADITITVEDGNTSVGTFAIQNDVAYIRYTVIGSLAESNAMIVYGDSLPLFYVPYGHSLQATSALQDAVKGNPLSGKVAVFDGDSICAASTDDSGNGAYAGRISVDNGITVHNYAVGGGTITSETYSGETPRHWIVDSIDTIYSAYPNADYIILEGGTNDADTIGSIISGTTPERFGSYDLIDYSGSYDDETFCGAVETLFFKAINYWHDKKIGFVIAMKMGKSSTGYTPETNNRRAYFETIMILAKKWGIPYLNLWDNCYMNPNLLVCYDSTKTTEQNIQEGKMYKDGQHPAPHGYDYIADIIGNWMKTL